MKISKDKIKHAIACGGTAIGVSAAEGVSGATYIQAWLAGFAAGTAIGVGKEYGDHAAEGNRWDWEDIVADEIGAAIGATIGSIVTILK